ncbi:hypothetical protein KIN20_010888 [Parelaphostrongylus tenuis]|uniref:Uncharacterized protein n=1 Tax=Parelaphostrongylus tenuis TaxID=148309 RepID=A0AAD5MU62_PARTN|nr:hypothetical protein KIN20_010888 [Parelaphostrongylus tenuis]
MQDTYVLAPSLAVPSPVPSHHTTLRAPAMYVARTPQMPNHSTWRLGQHGAMEFKCASRVGHKMREAFEGGFFDGAGLGCIEGLMEFESREEYRGIQHQLEERWAPREGSTNSGVSDALMG